VDTRTFGRGVLKGVAMGPIIGLAFASAASLTPQLLAVALVILTRPQPRPLLWAFWLTALIVSCTVGYVLLVVFRAKGTILGTTSNKVSPAVYLVAGCIAVAVAVFAATKPGRELLGRELEKAQQGKAEGKPEGSIGARVSTKVDQTKTKAKEAMMSGSVLVAIVVGVVLGAPTAFSPVAIGRMVRDGYSLPIQVILVVVFSLITYLVIEIPIVSYAVRPESTSASVESFSTWLGTHKIQAVAAVVAVVGLALIVKGVTAL
jgi:Sap, sulfolipid-1-addressing protein